MSVLAGFCSEAHPLAASEAERLGGRDVWIVRASNDNRAPADWYALAARWSALGGFVPLSWRQTIGAAEVSLLGAEADELIRAAIASCAGQVEIAFRLERLAASAEAASSSPGRAYLGALRREEEARRGFLSALSARAAERGYALSLTTATPAGVTGLLRCRAEQLADARQAVAAIASGARLSLSGALPPFGAGVELAQRLGLHPARRAA
jgi:hypothetical protein